MDLLFVYGTLQQGINSPMAAHLEKHAEFFGEAYLPGQLYDIGSYPGALYDSSGDERVFGHLFRLVGADFLFKILDEYEMIVPERTDNEYTRVLRPIWFRGQQIHSWVYLYNQSPTGLPKIPSGNYLEYLATAPQSHRDFIKGH